MHFKNALRSAFVILSDDFKDGADQDDSDASAAIDDVQGQHEQGSTAASRKRARTEAAAGRPDSQRLRPN